MRSRLPLDVRDELVSLLGGMCFFLSTVEHVIPKPLPFFRVGLANLPLLISPDLLPFCAYARLVFLKVIGQALVSGTLFSYVFVLSLAGSTASGALMYALRFVPCRYLSCVGISVMGAFCSNVIQLTLARVLVFGAGVWYVLPLFCALGAVSSTLLGALTGHFLSHSQWYAHLQNAACGQQDTAPPASLFFSVQAGCECTAPCSEHGLRPRVLRYVRMGTGLLLLLILLCVPRLSVQASVCGIALLLYAATGGRIRWMTLAGLWVGTLACYLRPPVGRVWATVLGVPLTSGALSAGARQACMASGMVYLSKWILRVPPHLPGKFGQTVVHALSLMHRLSSFKLRGARRNATQEIDRILLALWATRQRTPTRR
ncbi:Gx transporter family protein [Treponema pallidum]|uniref:Gx transporter family protein n=1 Tax=Treponema pallidum TaxID=160 RepID=UPI001F196DE3|nr:Gx transporter family protein [Treponema pallidum]